MIKRALSNIAFSRTFGRQMRFITGPRQTGKTTLAKHLISVKKGFYFNWDKRIIREKYHSRPYFFDDEILSKSSPRVKKWVCFDEIHKMPRWKDILKDFFDSFEEKYMFIVTGSARLDFFRKSGDSLAGRYFTFHLSPVTLNEMIGRAGPVVEPKHASGFILNQLGKPVYADTELNDLLVFSGFPEPLCNGTKTFHTKWHRDYLDRLVNEDMRDLTRIENLENTFTLMKLLPERVGSPLSIKGLSDNLLIGYKAVKNLLRALELLLVIFTIKPWHKRIQRAVQKEPKLYFYDWTHLKKESVLFENYVAAELKSRVDLWTDSGFGDFDLYFIRTKDGKETDFLITKEEKPWLLCETKQSAGNIDRHHYKISNMLGSIPFVQIVKESGMAKEIKKNFFVVSASRFFTTL